MSSGESRGTAHLREGAEWADHEDCIVGDEAGLRNLKRACEIALETGEYFGGDLGDWVGVKKLEAEWFQDPQDSTSTRVGSWVLGAILMAFLACALIGVVTVFRWLGD